MSTQLKKGALELCVLALLRDQDRYGYELATTISEEIEVTLGTIYPLLKRIKEVGYVSTEVRESADGPARKYYHLTAAGRAAFARSLDEWTRFTTSINTMIGAHDDQG
ncbi:MAG: PadR family transcriptional regulator [Propionibacteriaceae bacterium]|jgi:PadR family transcriptional regulator PadR|nr:PadR family transcriptional regulator [Propionibacteriaceae bacterium]